MKNIVALEPGAGIKMETECNELYEYHVVDQVSVLKKNFLRSYFTNVRNKLERLSMAGLSSLVYCLWARPGAYPIV